MTSLRLFADEAAWWGLRTLGLQLLLQVYSQRSHRYGWEGLVERLEKQRSL